MREVDRGNILADAVRDAGERRADLGGPQEQRGLVVLRVYEPRTAGDLDVSRVRFRPLSHL